MADTGEGELIGPKSHEDGDIGWLDDKQLLPELVAHLREHRTQLRQEWVQRIDQSRLLTAMTPQEVHSETTSVYDNYVEVLETGSVEALRSYARDLSERIIPRGVETNEVVGIVLLLRDVLARSLFQKYASDLTLLDHVLDAYEPAANRIANTVAVSFVDERERIIRQQQDAIRELSTPVLQVRVIITGLSSRIAQTLVTIGVDLSKMHTIGDLQGGIEEAERLLGFTVVRRSDPTPMIEEG
jgi:rsbT co-antagonist protein RsbR